METSTIFLLFFPLLTAGIKIPPEIKMCHKTDDECMKKAFETGLNIFRNGSEKLHLAAIEPFFISKLDLTERDNFKQLYKNVRLYGISYSKIENFSTHATGWDMTLWSPYFRLTSDYWLKARISSIMTLDSHGRSDFKSWNVTTRIYIDFEEFHKRNKTYLRVRNMTIDLIPEVSKVDFSNLIPGNEEMSKMMIKYLNENIHEIWVDIKPQFEQMLAYALATTLDRFFERLPEKKLFLP